MTDEEPEASFEVARLKMACGGPHRLAVAESQPSHEGRVSYNGSLQPTPIFDTLCIAMEDRCDYCFCSSPQILGCTLACVSPSVFSVIRAAMPRFT